MLPDLDELVALIRTVAQEELLPRFQCVHSRFKSDGSLLTEADLAVQSRLFSALSLRYPDILFLGEEMEDVDQQAFLTGSPGWYWCLDPLDGTSNFVAGLPFYAISLALMYGHEPRLGIVYDVAGNECFTAIHGQGAWLDGKRMLLAPVNQSLRQCLAMVGFKRLSRRMAAALVSDPPYRSHRYLGAGALEWCWLAAGRFQLYLHGEQKLWDYAAGALILSESGGVARALNNEPIYTPGVLAQSVIAATDKRLFKEWRRALTEACSD